MDRTKRLHELQQIENENAKAQSRLAEIEEIMGDTPALRQARQQKQETQDELMRQTVRQTDCELQVGSLKQKIADAEKQLYSGSITNPKELSDRQAELASLNRRLESLEEECLEAMIAREDAEEAAEQAVVDLESVENEWATDQQDLLEEKRGLEARVEELADSRVELLSKIPEGDLEAYQGLRRSKGSRVVVELQHGACTGCAMEVPSALLQQVGGADLVFCGNCERILLAE